jgi:gamma-glutamylcyclotransferase
MNIVFYTSRFYERMNDAAQIDRNLKYGVRAVCATGIGITSSVHTDNHIFLYRTPRGSKVHAMDGCDRLSTLPQTLYFGYGSNLWLKQMSLRCPDSPYAGIAVLRDWRWVINERGYANVVPSTGDLVIGLVYNLAQKDEQRLDRNEGVPLDYVKKMLKADVTWVNGDGSEETEVTVLVYVDELRMKESTPNEEYVWRMNMGIADAVAKGMPTKYVDRYLRPFIRAEDDEKVEALAVPRVIA